jgi:hypothetical protein
MEARRALRLGGPGVCSGGVALAAAVGSAHGLGGVAVWGTAVGAVGSSRLLGRLLVDREGTLPRVAGEEDLSRKVAVLPLGAGEAEGTRLAARGRLVLVGIGVEGVDSGTVPEIVRFLLALGVGVWLRGASSRVMWRPRVLAVSMKYDSPLSLVCFTIKASSAAARLSSSLAFHSFHFSSTSVAAALVTFSLQFLLISMKSSWKLVIPSPVIGPRSSAVAARRWKKVGKVG